MGNVNRTLVAQMGNLESNQPTPKNDKKLRENNELPELFRHPKINYSLTISLKIVDFIRILFEKGRSWNLHGFINFLDILYSYTRIRFTKGGHKVNKNKVMRQCFVC